MVGKTGWGDPDCGSYVGIAIPMSQEREEGLREGQ